MLMWDLSRAGVISRALSIVHLLSGVAFLVLVIGVLIHFGSTVTVGALVVLTLLYLLSWMAIGASLLRGVPRAHEPATGV
jgi:hypothetical protein